MINADYRGPIIKEKNHIAGQQTSCHVTVTATITITVVLTVTICSKSVNVAC